MNERFIEVTFKHGEAACFINTRFITRISPNAKGSYISVLGEQQSLEVLEKPSTILLLIEEAE